MSKHNLNIHQYSFKELLELFDLSDTISVDDLKRAKKKVLMTHPDKSKLPSEYFLFYKKAFEIIYSFYENKVKESVEVPKEKIDYEALDSSNSKEIKQQMDNVMKNMDERDFQKKFNTLFEKNIIKKESIDNSWFKNESPQFDMNNTTKDNMGAQFNQLKQQNKIVKHNDIRTLNGRGTNLYDEELDNYIDCDPFSKLKFDDLRRVHKDETIMSVSENDINNMKTYNSVESLKFDRGQTLTPIDKQKAENMIQNNYKLKEQDIQQKQYQANLNTIKYEEKNKSVLANFLRLT